MNISISICPTSLEVGSEGHLYDEGRLLDAIRAWIEQRHPGATITCLQVGHRQGDAWAKVDGDSEAGRELLAAFFESHGDDEDLFVPEPEPIDVELAEADETIRICGGLEDYAGLEHPAMQAACQAYHAAVAEALADDPRAARFNVRSPQGRRRLHSQWMGAQFAHSCGAIGVIVGALTDDEKAAISAADDAGRAAARNEIDAEDAAGVNE